MVREREAACFHCPFGDIEHVSGIRNFIQHVSEKHDLNIGEYHCFECGKVKLDKQVMVNHLEGSHRLKMAMDSTVYLLKTSSNRVLPLLDRFANVASKRQLECLVLECLVCSGVYRTSRLFREHLHNDHGGPVFPKDYGKVISIVSDGAIEREQVKGGATKIEHKEKKPGGSSLPSSSPSDKRWVICCHVTYDLNPAFSLSLSLSLSVFVYISIYLSVSLYLSFFLSLPLSFCSFLSLLFLSSFSPIYFPLTL